MLRIPGREPNSYETYTAMNSFTQDTDLQKLQRAISPDEYANIYHRHRTPNTNTMEPKNRTLVQALLIVAIIAGILSPAPLASTQRPEATVTAMAGDPGTLPRHATPSPLLLQRSCCWRRCPRAPACGTDA